MGTVHVSISHNNDFVVPKFFNIEILSNTCSQRSNYWLQLFVVNYLINASTFYVQHLSPQRKNSLNLWISSLLGRTTCRVTLYNVNLAFFGIFGRTICQLSRKTKAIHTSLTAGCFLGLASCNTSSCFCHSLF